MNVARYIVIGITEDMPSGIYPCNVPLVVLRTVVVFHSPSEFNAQYQLDRCGSFWGIRYEPKPFENFQDAVDAATALDHELRDRAVERGNAVPLWKDIKHKLEQFSNAY